MKNNAIILFALTLAACFVAGFASTFSFLGRVADVVGVVILLVLLDQQLKHERAQTDKMEILERSVRTLSQQLADAKEDAAGWRKLAEEKEKSPVE